METYYRGFFQYIHIQNKKSLNIISLEQEFSGPNRYHRLANGKLSVRNGLPLLELLIRETRRSSNNTIIASALGYPTVIDSKTLLLGTLLT